MHTWLMLVAAIATEVAGTAFLKASDGFSRPGPALAVVGFYLLSFVLLAQVLRSVDVGVAYAIWSGLGTALVAASGVLFFGEAITAVRLLSLCLIVGGVVGLQLTNSVQ